MDIVYLRNISINTLHKDDDDDDDNNNNNIIMSFGRTLNYRQYTGIIGNSLTVLYVLNSSREAL